MRKWGHEWGPWKCSYDAAGRLTGETQSLHTGPSGSFTYNYDTDGNLASHTRPDGNVIDYDYDLRNLLKQIDNDGPPLVAEYTYNGRNQLHQTKVENNPHFPALRSGPLALSGASSRKQITSSPICS